MAFSNIAPVQGPVGAGKLETLLQISYNKMVRQQLSASFVEWEMVRQMRVGNPDGRQRNFMLQTGRGPSSVQYRNPGLAGGAFPAAHQSQMVEGRAVFKEMDLAITLPYNLWDLAQTSPAKYAEPLAVELSSKPLAAKRLLAASVFGDGTGVVCEVASTGAATLSAAGDVVVTVSVATGARGHLGFCEIDDLLIPAVTAGTLVAPTGAGMSGLTLGQNAGGAFSNSAVAYRVIRVNRKLRQVTLRLVNQATLAAAPSPTGISHNLAAGDLFYRVGQPTIPDLSGAVADYGSITEAFLGMESLISDDGRIVHGITMSGVTGSTVVDCGGGIIDVPFIHEALDEVKINVGRDVYKWSKLMLAPEATRVLIEGRETDRRFNSVEDNKRGVRVFAYVHESDTVEVRSSEFVPFARGYILPEGGPQGKVFEFYSTDWKAAKAPQGGGQFMFAPFSAGGYSRDFVGYMCMRGTLINQHPKACVKLTNFLLS